MKFRQLIFIISVLVIGLQIPWLISQSANASTSVQVAEPSDHLAEVPSAAVDHIAKEVSSQKIGVNATRAKPPRALRETSEVSHREASHSETSEVSPQGGFALAPESRQRMGPTSQKNNLNVHTTSSHATTRASNSRLCKCEINLSDNRHTCKNIPAISFIEIQSNNQAVIKINLDPYEYGYTQAHFEVEYGSSPDGWTVNIGDSESNDGDGSDAGHQSNNAQMQIFNNDMKVYLADVVDSTQPLINNLLITKGSTISLTVRNKYLAWENNHDETGEYNRPGLYALHGQVDLKGPINYDIYAGFNRTINTSQRRGWGVSTVKIDLCSNPEIGVTKTVSSSPTQANGPLTYQLQLTASHEIATIALSNTLPSGLSYVDNSLTGGATYDKDTGQIHYNGPLKAGTPHLISYQATFDSTPLPGSIFYSPTNVKWNHTQLETGLTTVIPDTGHDAKTLALIYANGDNDLSTDMLNLVKRVEHAAENENLVTFLLLDGPAPGDAYLYRVKPSVDGCIKYDPVLCGSYEPLINRWKWDDSIAVPDSLSAFLIGSKNAYPNADNIILSLVGHGYGWMSPVLEARFDDLTTRSTLQRTASAVTTSEITAEAVTTNLLGLGHGTQPGGFLHDDHRYRSLSVAELGDALEKFYNATGEQLDLIYLDACSMAMTEVAYEIYASGHYGEPGSVGYLLASENTAWTSFRYQEPLSAITDNPSPLKIGQQWLKTEANHLLPYDYPFTLSLIDLTKMGLVRDAQDKLANALIDELPSNKDKIEQAFMSSDCFDSNGDYRIEMPTDNYCDLHSFADQLISQFGSGPVHSAAEHVKIAIDSAVQEERHNNGIPWNRRDQYWGWNELGGISVYLPLIEDEWRRRYYNHINLQSAADGLWDEFLLEYWEDQAPPPLFSNITNTIRAGQLSLASIELQVSPSSNRNTLNWVVTEELDGTLNRYQLYRSADKGQSYSFLGNTSKTSYTDTSLLSGVQYCYQVHAFDNSETLIRSNVFCVGEEPSITSVTPRYGLNDVSSAVYIYGDHFSEPLKVMLGSQTLAVNAVQLDETPQRIRAVVPEGLTPGAYDITVETKFGQGSKANAYTVIEATEVDDLLSNPEWLWTEPFPIRVGFTQSSVGVLVQHLGGTRTLDSVTVEFRLDGPDGPLLGRSLTNLLAPDAIESTGPVTWEPTEPSHPDDDPIEYTVCAIIDPDNEVAESNESNNITCRSRSSGSAVTVLPPYCLPNDAECQEGEDTEPPEVDRFMIADDAPSTLNTAVTLDMKATDYPNPGGSGMGTMKLLEFEYILGARSWVAVKQSSWEAYESVQEDHPWQLQSTFGMRYMQAWAADNNRNISLQPGADVIDLLPTEQADTVGRNGVIFYRILLEQGETFAATMTPESGNPDMFVWYPDSTINHAADLSGIEKVQFTAPIKGTYQIEIHAPTTSSASYRLAFDASLSTQIKAPEAIEQLGQEIPDKPAVPLDEWPLYYNLDLPPTVETTDQTIYLPISIR